MMYYVTWGGDMPIWLSAMLIILLALVIDATIGDPPNRIHPLRWMGNMVGWFDRHISRTSPGRTKFKGFLSYLAVTLIFMTVAVFILALVRFYLGEIAWIIVSALFLKMTFAIFSFRKHCRPIETDLRNGDTDAAADKTQMIVSRNTKGMDAPHISSSCVETVAENFADSVCSPLFFSGFFGLIGSTVFRTTNMMDAMWGYRNEKYGDIGYFPAKFDDVLGYVTSRISIVFIAMSAFLMRMDAGSAIRTARAENGKTASPNSGWPMAAVAGAMGITMEKENVYRIGNGPLPSVDDIGRSYRLVELASVLFILLITIPLYVFLGVHVQMFFENLFIGVLEGLF
ncbi:cobalamin biosynthesis protein [Porphyromonadaceae bacterium OttesenSCG-928-L07]|nr:cobalamin biosynthesis protein [Porphyromonadaceae bacterium OttesenSCG-928-L07]